jgi:Protein tyrosine and serine/threonine kinase
LPANIPGLSLLILTRTSADTPGDPTNAQPQTHGIFVLCTDFFSNTAGQGGAFMHVVYGTTKETYPIRIASCTFETNQAALDHGGAAYLRDSTNTVISDTIFRQNSAVSRGGALRFSGVNVVFDRCLLDGNYATERGGAITCSDSNPATITLRSTLAFTNTDGDRKQFIGAGGGCSGCTWNSDTPFSPCYDQGCSSPDACFECSGLNTSCTVAGRGPNVRPNNCDAFGVPASSSTGESAAEETATSSTGGGGNLLIFILIPVVAVVCLLVAVVAVVVWRRRASADLPPSADSENEASTAKKGNDTVAMSTITDDSGDEFEYLEDIDVGRKLGAGQFGTVFQGTWTGTPVALKLIDALAVASAGAAAEVALREFENECRVLAGFRHPNIIQLFGLAHEESGNGTYMVMEFCKQGSVSDLLQKKVREGNPLPAEEKLRMVVDAAQGVEYLHRQKTQHRDLACRNLLVDKAGTVKVGDFGLARQTGDDVYVSASKQAAVPVRWASPEQLGQGSTSLASDVYSFAVTVWELFSDGALPFAGMKNAEVSQTVLAGETAEHLTAPRCVSETNLDFAAVVAVCWSLNPESRPAMKVFRQQLEGAGDAAGSSSGGDEPAYILTNGPADYAKTPALDTDDPDYQAPP